MKVIFFTCVCGIVICSQILSTKCTDPCDNYNWLDENHAAESRSTANVYNYTWQTAISDDRLDPEGWYRVKSNAGEEMPTSTPELLRCGTWTPIWLNGDLPALADGEVTRPVCVHGFTGNCTRTWNIRIKRCSEYFVYDLIKSPVLDAAYCFGNITRCPVGESSETYYTPNCSSDFPTDAFSPKVEVSRTTGSINNPIFGLNVEPVFSCSFTDTGDGYAYDIRWNINACSVRARNSVDSTPGFYSNSENFVAGVVVTPQPTCTGCETLFKLADQTVYEVDEGGSIEINISSTVPVGCVGSSALLLSKCKETIKIGYPRNESCSSASSSSSTSDIITETCGTDLVADDSLAIHTLKVYGNVDNLYNQFNPRATTISFVHVSGAKDVSGAWDKVIIPDITVYIRDTDHQLLQRTCRTYTDPNYNTFDGRYYSSQITGEYVLYRHKREPYWVHTLSSACSHGTCNVGVAVRSHNSQFTVRTFDLIRNPTSNPFRVTYSGSRGFPMVDFRACDDKNMIITRVNSNSFKVKLPSGTEISFYARQWWDPQWNYQLYILQHVTIKPSVLDIGQTEGLCGFLSSNADNSDDFQPRGSTTARPSADTTFINSWFISNTSSESMFSGRATFPENYYYRPFCACAKQANGSTPIADDFNEINCNLTEPADQCYDSTTNLDDNLYSTCSKRKRREAIFFQERKHRNKRSMDDSDDVENDPTHLVYADDFVENYIPPELDWPGDWTNESARAVCEDRFINDPAVAICIEYAQSNTEEYIVGCMTDIKATNSTTLVDDAVATLIAGCLIEVSRNQTLILTDSDNDNGDSFLDDIKSKLCTNNCSSNGICVKGTCNCSAGYISDDCSILNTQPPSKGTIPNNGKCGTRQRSCQRTNVYGNFESLDVWCRRHHFQIVNFTKGYTSTPVDQRAEYHSPDRISCPLVSSVRRRKRSISETMAEGFDISLSYDGLNFGESTTIIIYDEHCYDCNATTQTCISLETCPSENTSDSTVSTTTEESNNTLSTDHSTELTTLTTENGHTTTTIPGNAPTSDLTTTTVPTTQQMTENSDSTSSTLATTEPGNIPTSDLSTTTVSTTRQRTGNSESESGGSGDNTVVVAVVSVVVIVVIGIVIAGIVIYKKSKSPNVKHSTTAPTEIYESEDNYTPTSSIADFNTFNGTNVPPPSTDFTRENSDLNFGWATERARTPDHLFLASEYIPR